MLIPLQIALVIGITCVQGRQQCSGTGSPCPEDAPCCARDGWCDSDRRQCILGCQPFDSFEPTSCAPMPICEDWSVDFRDGLGATFKGPWREYTNEVDRYDWVLMGRGLASESWDKDTIIEEQDDGIRLKIDAPYRSGPEGNRLISTRYMQYGTVNVMLKTAPWEAIVTTMMLVSDNREMIRFDQINHNGSRFLATQGLLTPVLETVPTMPSVLDELESVHDWEEIDAPDDVSDEYHKYTFDWQEDYIRWLIDDEEVRRLERSDLNTTGGNRYPDMPSRLEIGILNPQAWGTRPGWEDDGVLWIDIQSVDVTCGESTTNTTPVDDDVTGWVYNTNSRREEPLVRYTDEDIRVSGSPATAMLTHVACLLPVITVTMAALL